jgi:hypothetical protein
LAAIQTSIWDVIGGEIGALSAGRAGPQRVHLVGGAAPALVAGARERFPGVEIISDADGTQLYSLLALAIREPAANDTTPFQLVLRAQLPRSLARGASNSVIWPLGSRSGEKITTGPVRVGTAPVDVIYVSKEFPEGTRLAGLNELSTIDIGRELRITVAVSGMSASMVSVSFAINGTLDPATLLIDTDSGTAEKISPQTKLALQG